MSCKLAIAAVGLLALGGCNTVNPVSGSVDPGFGEALKYDMAIQTIDPDPVYGPDAAQPGDHGEKGSAAVKRYRTDAVKEVQVMGTTSGGGGGGGGGSGGGGPQ